MTASIHALRLTVAAAVLGTASLAAGHAVAKNHDCQSFRLPGVTLATHDRAPGPSSPRLPD